MNFAQWIPGTKASAVRGLNNAMEGTASISATNAVLGNMMNKTVGGALIGGIGNAAIYSQSGQGMGGATNYGEAIMGGAGVGAVAGAALGVMGAKSVMATAKGRIKRNEQKIAKATEKVLSRDPQLGDELQLLRRNTKENKALVKTGAMTKAEAGKMNAWNNNVVDGALNTAGLSRKAKKQLKTTVYSRPVNP